LVEIDDYQGASIINLLFHGITLNQHNYLCELRNIKIADIQWENNIITTIKREFMFDDSLKKILEGAADQTEAIDYSEIIQMPDISTGKHNRHLVLNNLEYLIRSRKRGSADITEPTHYTAICSRISAISEYINNPYINATYLNISGMIEYVKNNYTEDYYDRTGANSMQMYLELMDKFLLDTTEYNLKARLLPFLKS
jgi:hypothetical protein